MDRVRRHISFANVTSALALFVAMGGGTAIALTGQNTVFSDDIVNGQVKTADLADAGVTNAKLATASVTAGKIAPSSVNSGHIVNGQVAPIDIKPAEGWHPVAAGSSTADQCADPSKVAVFCSTDLAGPFVPWHNLGGSFAPASFYRDQLGIVHLRGVVVLPIEVAGVSDPLELNIFRLPAGYRPSTHQIFSVAGQSIDSDGTNDASAARVDVNPTGLVVDILDCGSSNNDCAGNGGFLSLSGIDFRP
jgi:hypothetical protein